MNRIKILDLNTWMLPWPFSKDNKKRLDLLVGLIKELKPDIVSLQEVWLKKYVHWLKKNLSGFYLFSGDTKAGVFNKSGLVILSKFNLIDKKRFTFRENKKFNIIEKIADKGNLQMNFICENKKITFINFQLYNAVKENEKDIIGNQFKKLTEIIKKPDVHSQDLVILAGDLNLSFKEFEEINNGLFLYSHNHTFTFSKSDLYTKSRLNPWLCNKYYKNDFVLVWPRKEGIFLNSRVIKKPLLSDHYAIFSEVIF